MNIERLRMMADYLEGTGQFECRGVDANKFHLDTFMTDTHKFVQKQIELSERTGSYKHIFEVAIKTRDTSQPAFTALPQTSESEFDDEVEPNYCQTVGCAMGWAATVPEFRALGLRLTKDYYGGTALEAAEIRYKGYRGTEAMAPFFDLRPVTAYNLFLANTYPSHQTGDAKAVARRIRKLLEMGDVQAFLAWCQDERLAVPATA